MEIESNLFFNTIFKINQKKNFSKFNKKYFKRIRGFDKIDINIPFSLKSKNSNLKKKNQNRKIQNFEFSLLHTLKLNLLYFPQIENQNIFPFFHFTNIFFFDQKNFFKHFVSSGIGMEFKMSDYVGIEVLFNFFHFYKNNHLFLKNKEESLQIRISMGD